MIRWYTMLLIAMTWAKKKKQEPVVKYVDLGSQLKYGLDEFEQEFIKDGIAVLLNTFPEQYLE